MINNLTTSNYTNLKGFIAELICEYHFSKLSYNIIPLGNEKISGLLPSINTLFKEGIVENGTYDANTFNILQNITQHLPDFVIWKLAPNQDFHNKNISAQNLLKIAFIEVKYRKKIDSEVFEIGKNRENDPLQLYKYLSYVEKQIGLLRDSDKIDSIDKVDFYVYLLTYDEPNKIHKILFGKVFKNPNKDTYRLHLYDKVNDEFNKKTGNKWNEYNSLKDFILLNNGKKLRYLFNDNFIYSLKNKSEQEVRQKVFEKLDEYDFE